VSCGSTGKRTVTARRWQRRRHQAAKARMQNKMATNNNNSHTRTMAHGNG